jgi:hypothetical protein
LSNLEKSFVDVVELIFPCEMAKIARISKKNSSARLKYTN